MTWILENLETILAALTAINVAAALLAALTPSKKDDAFLAKVQSVLDLLALSKLPRVSLIIRRCSRRPPSRPTRSGRCRRGEYPSCDRVAHVRKASDSVHESLFGHLRQMTRQFIWLPRQARCRV